MSALGDVLAAVRGGAASSSEVAARTGLDRDVAEAALDELVRLGLLGRARLDAACPSSGCGGCAADACSARGTTRAGRGLEGWTLGAPTPARAGEPTA